VFPAQTTITIKLKRPQHWGEKVLKRRFAFADYQNDGLLTAEANRKPDGFDMIIHRAELAAEQAEFEKFDFKEHCKGKAIGKDYFT
jgi:hypothetical protein